MIKSYKDIDHHTEEGKLLLIAIGTIRALMRHAGKPYNHPDEVVQELKEAEIIIDIDLITRDDL